MRSILLISIGSLALMALIGQGLLVYVHESCGQYPIFEPPCSRLLSAVQTEALLQSRQSAVEELMQVSPGFVRVSHSPQSRCSDKSLIFISHPSENDCDALNEILHRDFSDIPYRIVND